MVLPIKTYPDPILRNPTESVVFPLSKEMIKLTQDMVDTVRKADGSQCAGGLRKSVRVPLDLQGEGHVLQRAHVAHEVKLLEDEPHKAVPE